MFDEHAFRKAVAIVEGKLSRGEYSDYDHGCGQKCVVGKAFAEMLGREPLLGEPVSHVMHAVDYGSPLQALWSCRGMINTHDQQAGAKKARAYLQATKELADA